MIELMAVALELSVYLCPPRLIDLPTLHPPSPNAATRTGISPPSSPISPPSLAFLNTQGRIYMKEKTQRVVVTGLGPISAVGIGKDDFWKALLEGKCGIDKISGFDPSGLTCQIGAEVKGFDAKPYFKDKVAREEGREGRREEGSEGVRELREELSRYSDAFSQSKTSSLSSVFIFPFIIIEKRRP